MFAGAGGALDSRLFLPSRARINLRRPTSTRHRRTQEKELKLCQSPVAGYVPPQKYCNARRMMSAGGQRRCLSGETRILRGGT